MSETLRNDALAHTLALFASETTETDLVSIPEADATVPAGESRFQVVRVVGQGGMGRVLAAQDRQFGRNVAVKELTRRAPSDGDRRRFLLESLVTANLEHPGVPPVYERGGRDGRSWFAMRFVEGENLEEALGRTRTLAERLRFIPALVQVAHTLGYAHGRGVVHRDVKPENIMLGPHGQVLLVDWGIARVTGMADVLSVSPDPQVAAAGRGSQGEVLGTPAYMSPEQAHGNLAQLGPASDVYALGAVLFRVLTGRPLHTGPTPMAILASAAQGAPTELPREAMDAPEPLRAIVQRCLAREVDERYADGGELALALEAFVSGALTGPPARWARWMALGASAAALAVVLAIGWLIQGTVASLEEQGTFGYLYPTLLSAGLCLGAAEVATRGRLGLWRAGLGLIAATVLMSVVGTLTGYSLVWNLIAARGPVPEWPIFLLGLREASGNLVAGCLMATVQVLMWVVIVFLPRRTSTRLAAP